MEDLHFYVEDFFRWLKETTLSLVVLSIPIIVLEVIFRLVDTYIK